MKQPQVKIRFSKFGRNLYVILYGTPTQERIDLETARLKYRAEQLYGEWDKETFAEAIEAEYEK